MECSTLSQKEKDDQPVVLLVAGTGGKLLTTLDNKIDFVAVKDNQNADKNVLYEILL